ncbi:unnamed protein product, partial [Cyprideis torosa]
MIDDEEEFVYAERPNRTLLKQETEAYKALVLRMMNMSETLFKKLDISDKLRDAVLDARRFKVGARKRQIRYTTGLLRHEDCAAINAQIDQLERPARQQIGEFHQLEAWRDQLLAGDADVFDTLMARFDGVDIQYLRQLTLREHGETFLFWFLFLFSILTPLVKMVGLALIANTGSRFRRAHEKFLYVLETWGKWSMLDVFVVALLFVSVKLGSLANVTVHEGLYWFGGA